MFLPFEFVNLRFKSLAIEIDVHSSLDVAGLELFRFAYIQ
jgi:hypothetical protein